MRRPAVAVVLWAALFACLPGAAVAQGLLDGLTMILDTNVGSTTTRITDTASGTVMTESFDTLFPRLTVNADATLYPTLRLSTGGVFEIQAISSNGGAESSILRLRPFVELRSSGEVLAPGVSYYRREVRTRVSGLAETNLVNEDYAAFLAWRPAGLPQSDVQFVRTNTFDGGREFIDNTRDFGSVRSRYTRDTVSVYYLGSLLDATDRINGVESRQVSHSGKVDYSRAFLDRRLLWNASYQLGHFSAATAATGEGGEVALPLVPTAGLSTLSDTPVTARLTPNPPLIDTNLTAGAGINLGVPPPGSEVLARNIGLDFLNPVEVTRLLVFVDRELPIEISRVFSWEVYTSPDNVIWRRETTIASAPFGPFENRFQIDFTGVTTRYVKVVTRPLPGTVPDASRYQDIFVTEVQAFLTRPAGELSGTVERTSQNFITDLRYRILDSPTLFYEGSYWFQDGGTAARATHLASNGLSFSQRLNRVFGTYGRGAVETGTQDEGIRVAAVTNAALTFDPIPTLTGSLLYAGQTEWFEDDSNARRAFTVQTSSQVYRGVDVQLGLGWSFITRETGEELRDRTLNVTSTIVPRQNLTLTLTYANSRTTRSGVLSGLPEFRSQRVFATVAYDPIRALHVVVSQEVQAEAGERARTFTNLNLNWSAFPDGALQIFLSYNESWQPLDYGTSRDLRPGLRWWISRRSYLEVAYQRLVTEFARGTTDTRSVFANLRLFF